MLRFLVMVSMGPCTPALPTHYLHHFPFPVVISLCRPLYYMHTLCHHCPLLPQYHAGLHTTHLYLLHYSHLPLYRLSPPSFPLASPTHATHLSLLLPAPPAARRAALLPYNAGFSQRWRRAMLRQRFQRFLPLSSWFQPLCFACAFHFCVLQGWFVRGFRVRCLRLPLSSRRRRLHTLTRL